MLKRWPQSQHQLLMSCQRQQTLVWWVPCSASETYTQRASWVDGHIPNVTPEIISASSAGTQNNIASFYNQQKHCVYSCFQINGLEFTNTCLKITRVKILLPAQCTAEGKLPSRMKGFCMNTDSCKVLSSSWRSTSKFRILSCHITLLDYTHLFSVNLS